MQVSTPLIKLAQEKMYRIVILAAKSKDDLATFVTKVERSYA